MRIFAYRQTASATHTSVPHAVSSGPVGTFGPCQIVLLGSLAPGWECVQALPLAIAQDEDSSFIASDSIFHMYGLGDSLPDAVRDYVKVLTEYYQHLAPDNDEPSRALFDYLRTFIRPR